MPASFRTSPVQCKNQGWGDGHSFGRQKSSLLVNYHWFPTVHTYSHGLISIRCISMSFLWLKLHFAFIWIWMYRSVDSFKRPMGLHTFSCRQIQPHHGRSWSRGSVNSAVWTPIQKSKNVEKTAFSLSCHGRWSCFSDKCHGNSINSNCKILLLFTTCRVVLWLNVCGRHIFKLQ